jgi:hypothetical protein
MPYQDFVKMQPLVSWGELSRLEAKGIPAELWYFAEFSCTCETHEAHWRSVVGLITCHRKGGRVMLLDGKYVKDEDAARQIKVTPITFRRWLGVGTMPQFQFEGTNYVLQSDVDAFVEGCQCRNQRKTYEPKAMKAVAS